MPRTRSASHAGSWYSSRPSELHNELSGWLNNASFAKHSSVRAIIAPHAGYRFSGPCAAWAYKQIVPEQVERVFILGPSHHVHLNGCAVTTTDQYETPFYNLKIDKQMNDELLATGAFSKMDLSTDEDEHSIEMQLPYLAKVMESKSKQFTVIPILVGSINPEKEKEYGKILSPYMMDHANIFIISSDFCHWGSRFSYNHFDSSCGQIWESISALDHTGMNLIEQMDPKPFSDYLRKTRNTICGRHPISVLLNVSN